MTLTLDRLEAAGWITREPDPTDRRRQRVRLTAAGRRLAVEVNDSLHEWERALVGRRQLRTMVGTIDDLLGLLERA
jgi:DNA-binding MarR family transcriptional regulator